MAKFGAAVFLALLALSDCASEPSLDGPDATLFAEKVASSLEDPALSAEARAILIDIQDGGEVTFENYRRAVDLWTDCATELGFTVQQIETRNEGQIRYAAAFEYPDGIYSEEDQGYDALTAAGEACRATNLAAIEQLYITQPVALELRSGYFEQFRESTDACLGDHGIELPDGASVSDYQDESNTLAEVVGVDCLYEAGYYDTGDPVVFD